MDHFTRLENKLDKISTDIVEMKTTLVKQQGILDEHVRRTNLLEEKVEPIEKHVTMIQGFMTITVAILKLSLKIASAGAVMGGVMKAIEHMVKQ